MIKKAILIITTLFFSHLGMSQAFEAHLAAGFAASQIDGDLLRGYNQLGGVFGGATNFNVSEKVKFQQEIVYYGRGSRINPNQPSFNSFTVKGLHYVDILGLLNFHLDEALFLQGGLGYGSLIYLRTDVLDDASNYKSDIFWTAGLGYYINEKIIAQGRFQYSLGTISKFGPVYNNTMNFGLHFVINGE